MKKYLFQNKILFTGVMISLLLNAFGELLKAKMMGSLLQVGIDRVNFDIIRLLGSILITVGIIVLISIVSEFVSARFISYSLGKIKEDWMETLLQKQINTFREKDTSTYLSNFTSDINLVVCGIGYCDMQCTLLFFAIYCSDLLDSWSN